jgi:hypothetical protein
MSEQEHKREAFIEKRARALALLLLTRREDLLIEEVKEDIGLDYLVRFPTKGKGGLRELGVAVRGAWAAVTKAQADKALRLSMRVMKRHGSFVRPVCLFFFTMEDDGAWYIWVAEPVVSEDGKALLRSCDEPDCRQLDKRAFKEILARVDSWHDALLLTLIVNGPEGTKAERKQATQ